MPLLIDYASRFWPKVDKNGPVPEQRPDLGACWVWTAARNNMGYGKFGASLDGRKRTLHAHRVAYELVIGPIPEGLELDHLCRRPLCVNPAHLEPVTHRENILRGMAPCAISARKTQCDAGHEFTAENTYVYPSGSRRCRTCAREQGRRTDARPERRARREKYPRRRTARA